MVFINFWCCCQLVLPLNILYHIANRLLKDLCALMLCVTVACILEDIYFFWQGCYSHFITSRMLFIIFLFLLFIIFLLAGMFCWQVVEGPLYSNIMCNSCLYIRRYLFFLAGMLFSFYNFQNDIHNIFVGSDVLLAGCWRIFML